MPKAYAVQLNVTKTIPTNITSSLAMSPTRKNFATITRQLSTESSQWIYRLEYYQMANLSKVQMIDIYNSYITDKHFLTFIPTSDNHSFLAVATANNIIFYRTNPLRKVNSVLHHQANVYDLTSSPDGQLIVLVGQNIVMHRTNGFKSVLFPQIVENARFCDFSRDGMYMVIASTSSINVYTYPKVNDNYQFQAVTLTNFQAPVNYESITSAEFNPNNATELIVGFLSSSPTIYSIDNDGSFIKRFDDIQPMSSKNAKIAHYFPDAQRYYSFDYLDGVGLWPGLQNKLYYKENFLLYDASSDALGTRLIGYVWQQIKVADIQLNCFGSGFDNKELDTRKNVTFDKKNQTYLLQCPCPNSQAWSYQKYECAELVCLQAEHSTGVIEQNACKCENRYVWDPVAKKCATDCSLISKALPLRPSLYTCACDSNWSWNSMTSSCQFDCTKIAYSTGGLAKEGECVCLPGFQWNKLINECECPMYMQPVNLQCLCYNNFYLSEEGNCLANCSMIANAVGPSNDLQKCVCNDGYYFAERQGVAGCQLNCSVIKDTTQEYDFNTCLCHEHMDWLNGVCVVNCKAISFSDTVGLQNNTCACAINYIWEDKIKECARSCGGVLYSDPKGQPTLQACPCIQHFIWNEANTRCEIQCSLIPNSEIYALLQIDKCQCRSGFIWNQAAFSCQLDCKSIWNAESRINDTHCKCIENQEFNSTSLTCAAAGTAGIFSSPLSIVGFAVGIVVALIILGFLASFCWKFKTEAKDKEEKKLKGKDPSKKKNKLIRQETAPPILDEELKTNERLKSPAKLGTATSL